MTSGGELQCRGTAKSTRGPPQKALTNSTNVVYPPLIVFPRGQKRQRQQTKGEGALLSLLNTPGEARNVGSPAPTVGQNDDPPTPQTYLFKI